MTVCMLGGPLQITYVWDDKNGCCWPDYRFVLVLSGGLVAESERFFK